MLRGRRGGSSVAAAGGERLEMAAARARPWQGGPSTSIVDVPELASRADRAAVEAAVEDQAAADPRPEREHHHVLRPAARAERCSASAAAFASFSIAAGRPKRGVEAIAEIDVRERDVDRA